MKYFVLAMGMFIVAAHIGASDSEKAFSFNDIDTKAFPYIWKTHVWYGDLYHKKDYPDDATSQQIQEVYNHPLCQCVAKKFQKNGTHDVEKLNQLDAVCKKLTIEPSSKPELEWLGKLAFGDNTKPEIQDVHDKAMALRNCVGVLKISYYTRSKAQLIAQVDKMLSNL